MARQHPGESPSSYVVQGLIDFLVSKHKIAEELREKLIFKVVPMVNPDGVYLGNYRGTLLGMDLNRVWHTTSEHANPTVNAIKNVINNLSKSENPLDFVMDVHVSNTMLGFFIVGNAYDLVFRNERHIVFPKMLAQNCKDFCQENTMYNKDADKEGTARRLLSAEIEDENTNVYSLEVSMFGYKPDSKKSDKILPYTEENYILQGRSICRALWDYYKISGHIEGCEIISEEDKLNAGDPEKILEISEFSMLRLNDIGEQRKMYSSIDDIVYAGSSDSEFDEEQCEKGQGFTLDTDIPALAPYSQEEELHNNRNTPSQIFVDEHQYMDRTLGHLPGLDMEDAGWRVDLQLGLSRPVELAVIGRSMDKHHPPPTRSMSRLSSLADMSQSIRLSHSGCFDMSGSSTLETPTNYNNDVTMDRMDKMLNIVSLQPDQCVPSSSSRRYSPVILHKPILPNRPQSGGLPGYQFYLEDQLNTLNYRGSGERRQVGGGGVLTQKGPLMSGPPLHYTQQRPGREDVEQYKKVGGCNYLVMQLNTTQENKQIGNRENTPRKRRRKRNQ